MYFPGGIKQGRKEAKLRCSIKVEVRGEKKTKKCAGEWYKVESEWYKVEVRSEWKRTPTLTSIRAWRDLR